MIQFREIADADELIAWRAEVIRNVFSVNPDARLIESNLKYYRQHIADGTHIAVVATADGKAAGCGAVCVTEELPSPDNPTGLCGYLMNIYVREDYRCRGIAHAIVGHLTGIARERGCGKIYLESTPMARNIYLTSGFEDMENMMKYDKA